MATAMDDPVDLKNIEFHEKVGQGGFGSVKRVTFKVPYMGYGEAAAKCVFDLCDKEVDIMSKLEHPNIVALLGFCQTGPADIILMEYASQGSLYDYLSDKSRPLPYDLMKKWAQESALAIQYLHRCNFLHRDIKPQNCLLFEDNLLKLCDFGLAREMIHSQTTSSQKGTFRYMAPEVLKGNDKGRPVYSKPADIYSYGMLVLQICTRKPPFDGLEWQQVIFELGMGKLPHIPEDCPKDMLDLIRRCWNPDPKGRPNIGSIVGALTDNYHTSMIREIHPQYQETELKATYLDCCTNGDIVVGSNKDLYILGRSGEYKMSLTSPDEQMDCINSVTVSSQNHVLVVDDSECIKVFKSDKDNGHVFQALLANAELPTKEVRLKGIALDRERQILVGDRAQNVITIYTYPDGQVVHKIKCGLPYVGGITVNSKRQILYSSHTLGTVYSKVVAIDYSGNEVFTFTPRIDEDVTGKLWTTGIVSSKIWEEIDGIVCDDFDNIYLAMSVIGIDNTGHIHKYSPQGEFLQCMARGLYDPCDLSIAHDYGALVVANDRSILFYSLT